MTTQNQKIQEVVGETTECPCCMENFNKRSHKPVTCNCGYICCVSCIKQYFANTTKLPHCMNCKQVWNYKFQYEQLGKNYVNVVYKKQRCELLFEIEKAKIPDTIHIVEHIKELQKTQEYVKGEIKYYEEEITKELEKEKQFMDELGLNKDKIIEWYNERCSKYLSCRYPVGTRGYKRKMNQHSISTNKIHHINEIYVLFNKKTSNIQYKLCNNHALHVDHFRNILYTLGQKEGELYTLYIQYQKLLTEKEKRETAVKECERTIQNSIKTGRLIEDNKHVKPKKQFIKPCPTENCKGFLSTQYKCGLCNVKVCPKCFDVIQFTMQTSGDGNPDAVAQVSGPHECKPENIESANMIKKETKPCPQCGVPIFKISGCNQMWCTGCNIAFDWRTGNIETGHIHNPHYFDWLKKNGGGQGNGQPVGCNGNIYGYEFRVLNCLDSSPSKTPKYAHIQNKISETIRTFIRMTHHIRGMVESLRNKIVTFDSFRIRYLLDEIDESKFKSLITRHDKQNEEYNDIANILELFQQVNQENLIQLRTFLDQNKHEYKYEYKYTPDGSIYDELIEVCLDIIRKNIEIYKYCREHVIQYNRCEKTLQAFYDISNLISNLNIN